MALKRHRTPSADIDGHLAACGGDCGGMEDRTVRAVMEDSRSPISKRRCTDVCCLFILGVCSAGLALSSVKNYKTGDMRVLRNGFNFRGELCGTSADPSAKGAYLHWCSARLANGHEEYRWDRPICVDSCPSGGEIVYCPDGEMTSTVSEERQYGGDKMLVEVSKQRLIPMNATPTQPVKGYCLPTDRGLPTDIGQGALVKLLSQTTYESWSSLAVHFVGYLENVLHKPRLLCVLIVMSMVCARAWIFLLYTFSQTLAHAVFVLSILALFTTGALAVQLPPVVEVVTKFESAGIEVVNATLAHATAAADNIVAAMSILTDAASWLEVVDSGNIQKVRICIGALLILAAGAMLLWYCFARGSITVAADCMREACGILSLYPSLLYVLPLLNCIMVVVVTLMSISCCMLLLSTADVYAVSYSINGEKVSGVFRNFVWTGRLVGGVAAWFFAYLFAQELVSAIRSYVLSHTVVCWCFSPTRKKSSWPLVKGIVVAVVFHLGSLTFGALILSILCAFRWLLVLVHELSERDYKCIKCILACLDVLVSLAEQIMKRVSHSAYTEMAITSANFCDASSSAASLMLEHAPLLWIRVVLLRPATFLTSVIYSCAFAHGVHVVLTSPARSLIEFLPRPLVNEIEGLGSPAVAASVAGVMCFLVVRCFTATLDDLSDAVLYCRLWDKRQGGGGELVSPGVCKSL
eukprot:TRINITY_DN35008_c0_g1_i1.p1 TRINITY_DN35008_c0_g1~~TRINITY_DN35008_c0_g1_i1.p1  ORF type:complete len:694 (+),score=84.91 TRINITY_DN35008_c0_g1_i1:96-2177(+)